MKLNIGCGCSFDGDVRLDIKRTKAVNIVADAHFLPFKDQSFSEIICTEVLEHLESPIKALKEMRRVLKNNGVIVVTVPNLTELRRALSIAINPSKVCNIETDHKQGWDTIEFRRLAFQAKLSIVNISYIDWYGQDNRKGRFKSLNPVLRYILPAPLYYKHIKVILRKGKQ
ncbi:MAG: class I SAM-dependent methyltransferase [Nitrososphaeria archaeon]